MLLGTTEHRGGYGASAGVLALQIIIDIIMKIMQLLLHRSPTSHSIIIIIIINNHDYHGNIIIKDHNRNHAIIRSCSLRLNSELGTNIEF